VWQVADSVAGTAVRCFIARDVPSVSLQNYSWLHWQWGRVMTVLRA